MEAKKRSPLGDIIKNARQKNGLTIEELAEKADITVRYLYRIENQDAKPSYELLYFLIREFGIDPDTIFYPDKPEQDNELESLIRRLYNCDERAIKVIKATATSLLNTLPENK